MIKSTFPVDDDENDGQQNDSVLAQAMLKSLTTPTIGKRNEESKREE